MPTTSDYLTSLQNDLSTIVTTLNLEEGTNFSDIKDSVLNGDITTGGGANLSEYFDNEPTTLTTSSVNPFINQVVKKIPDIIIPNTETELRYMTSSNSTSSLTCFPKIICGNNITDMRSCFYGGLSSAITTIDTTGLNTSNVTDMRYMFQNCSQLLSLDLSTFDTSKVTTMYNMFAGCSRIQEINISSFTIGSYCDCEKMFNSCNALSKIDMRNFDFSKITNYNYMFGSMEGNGPYDNCLIIVGTANDKTWINNNFPRLTNVKTVAEL